VGELAEGEGGFASPRLLVPSPRLPIREKNLVCKLETFTLGHFEEWARGLILDTGEPWELEDFQRAFLSDVFAGFRECWLVVPEGNTKTTTLAGLGLYHSQFRDAASAPIAASSREQAEIMYRQAEGFVLRSDNLRRIFKCQEGYRRIKCLTNGSRIQVFAADDRTGDGVIPTLPMLDELHRHRDLRLYRVWRGKLGKRDGQLVAISTAGEPGSEFEETRERIRQQADEIERKETFTRAVAGRVVLHDWSVPEDGDVEDLELVKRANPFSGVTVEELKEKRESPTMTLEHWRRFVCNLPTRGGQAAITEAEWFAAQIGDEKQTPAERWHEIVGHEPVAVGLDVAWKWDTTSAVPYWFRDNEFRLLGPPAILVPPRDGNSLDPNLVERALIDIHERNPIHTVVMDTSRAEQLAEWISQEFGAIVVDRVQTNKWAAEDYEKFMEALRQGWLKHCGDRGLTQHVLNGVARVLPFGDARFERPASGRLANQDRRVIDALTAAAMVNSVAGVAEEGFFLQSVAV
jgi:phage terminase large subunit-like protein